MLRVHLMQNWFAVSEPATEEALYEIASLRMFAGLGLEAIPDETTILNFRHLLANCCTSTSRSSGASKRSATASPATGRSVLATSAGTSSSWPWTTTAA